LSKEHPAHKGRRRRKFTQELFRCLHVTEARGRMLPCNALLWRYKPEDLREHLLEHLDENLVLSLTDQEVIQKYSDAARIHLEGVIDDSDE
jgi:hypothetical protein